MRNLIELVKGYAGGLSTLYEWSQRGLIVPQDQAQKRADICTGRISGIVCPNNIKGGLMPKLVSDAIKRQMELRLKLDLKVEGEDKLLSCSGCECPLKTKVFIPLEDLGVDESELSNFAPQCWMREEYKQKHETDKN